MNVSKKFIPSLFTILNAFCGFMSIINSSNGDYNQACYFIVYAALFDAFDGMIARLLNSSSDFGVELDSLSEVIFFGAEHSFLIYSIHFRNYDGIGVFVASSIMAFSALRLARFNISLVGFDKDKFTGVPVPMSALTIISYILFYHNKYFNPQTSNFIIFVLTISLSLLMVSKIKYPVLPGLSIYAIKKKPVQFLLLLIAIIISLITKGYGIFFICLLYLLFGIVEGIFNLITGRKGIIERKRHKKSRRK